MVGICFGTDTFIFCLFCFICTFSLREIIDSKPRQRQPRRLAALAHVAISGGNNSGNGSSGSNSTSVNSANENSATSSLQFQPEGGGSRMSSHKEEQNQPRVLNAHLQVPEAFQQMKEPVFLPLEWFDAGVASENALPVESWNGLQGKSKWYYSNGEWEWRSVTVLSYNQESARWHVQWNARPKKEIVTMSFFVTLSGNGGDSDGKGHTGSTGIAPELEQEVLIPTELPMTDELPSKWVSRNNVWFPSRESERQHRARMEAAKRQRDAYESRARYLAHVQAMAPLVHLPPVSVPSELFQCALARAGIQMETPADLQRMTPLQIRALAAITEEVRRGYIDTMDILHTQDIVTIPLPGLPTGAAGIPPPIRYESDSLQILREGGIPLWTVTCGCHEYNGIRAPLPVGSLMLGKTEKDQNEIQKETQKRQLMDVGGVVPDPPPSGYGTMAQGALTIDSPFNLISTYLPHANKDVLLSMQSVGVLVLHRIKSMDWLWGQNTVGPPDFCFQRSSITPKAKERAITHPWPPLPDREVLENGQERMDDPKVLPNLPCTLEVFVASQTRQHTNAAAIAHAHSMTWLDNIFADGYGVAVDAYAVELLLFEGRLKEARKKVSQQTIPLPANPSGIELPALLRPMFSKEGGDYNFKTLPKHSFNDRASSKMASGALKAPFRRALYVANLLVKNELTTITYNSIHRMVLLLQQYNLPILPDNSITPPTSTTNSPTASPLASPLASPTANRSKKSKGVNLSSIVGIFGNKQTTDTMNPKKKSSHAANPLAALSKMMSLKRMGGSLIQKLHRQRKKTKRLERRERRRSVRMETRRLMELERQAAAATLCQGGAPVKGRSGIQRQDFEQLVPYVVRMIRCQGHSRRNTALLEESSRYTIYEKREPLFCLTLNVVQVKQTSKKDRKERKERKEGKKEERKKDKKKDKKKEKKKKGGKEREKDDSNAILSFSPSLPSFETSLVGLIHGLIKSVNAWECVNIDMLMPFEGKYAFLVACLMI